MKPTICNVCKLESREPKFRLPGLQFSFLKGDPFICEKCLYLILTDNYIDWKDEFKEYIPDIIRPTLNDL